MTRRSSKQPGALDAWRQYTNWSITVNTRRGDSEANGFVGADSPHAAEVTLHLSTLS